MASIDTFIAVTFGVAADNFQATGSHSQFPFKMVSNQRSQIVTYAQGYLYYSPPSSIHIPGPLGGVDRFIPAHLSTAKGSSAQQFWSDEDSRDVGATGGVPFDPTQPEDLTIQIAYYPPSSLQVTLTFVTRGGSQVTFPVEAKGGCIYGCPNDDDPQSPLFVLSVPVPPAPPS